ncbi:hypothetical protein [Pseudoalteromonas rubra]|uniref:hypothetical protein n=1 Tax=Pseudoalteromonas rubra TaxID=43658 RepID=UPI001486512A|nr:hypothetical protein [Pseudoalteromonas rubra]
MNSNLTRIAMAVLLATSMNAYAKGKKIEICHHTRYDVRVIEVSMKRANRLIRNRGAFLPYVLYQDKDYDGFGNAEVSIKACTDYVDGYVDNDTDLDDTDPNVTDQPVATPPPPPAPTAMPPAPPSTVCAVPPAPTGMPPPPPTTFSNIPPPPPPTTFGGAPPPPV